MSERRDGLVWDVLDPAAQSPIVQWIGLIARIVAVVAVVGLTVEATGLGARADELVRANYHDVRGARETGQHVVLVAIDRSTVSAWGPPPWPDDRLGAMFATIGAGRPTSVTIVGDPALVGARAVPATARVVAGPTATDVPEINFIGTRGLPTLSAVSVAGGAIPSATFAGKEVVVGVTTSPYAGLTATPIGPLATPQLHAHARDAAAEGVVWARPAVALRLLVLAAIALLSMVAARHAATWLAFALSAATIAVIVVVDYALFASGLMLFGATTPIVTCLVATALERARERRAIWRSIQELGRQTRQRGASLRSEDGTDPERWERISAVVRGYVACKSVVITVLVDGGRRLGVLAMSGLTATSRPPRLDPSREPFRGIVHTPVWCDGFMREDAASTLVVPLMLRSRRVGFLLLNVDSRAEIGRPQIETIRALAQELAASIERGNVHDPLVARGALAALAGSGRLPRALASITDAVGAQAKRQDELATLGDAMPFGVFVATLWGEVRYMNAAMRSLCAKAGLGHDANTRSMAELVAGLSGVANPDLEPQLRQLVRELEVLRLEAVPGAQRHDLVLSWLPAGPDAGPWPEQLLLVSAVAAGVGVPRVRDVLPASALAGPRSPEDAVTVMRPRLQPPTPPGEVVIEAGAPPLPDDSLARRLARGTPVMERVHAAPPVAPVIPVRTRPVTPARPVAVVPHDDVVRKTLPFQKVAAEDVSDVDVTAPIPR